MILTVIHDLLLQVSSTFNELGETIKESDDATKALGIKWINAKDFIELLIRFAFNAVVVGIISKGFYYSKTKRKDFLFSFIMMSLIIFVLCYSLSNVKLQLGFAFGLFAIFGIMRFRTDSIPIKEMTYLFVIISVSVINSLVSKKISYAELLFANISIIVILYFLEKVWLLRHESVKRVVYERINLITPDKRAELIADLESRIGIKISRVEVNKIDFLKDVAVLFVYYFEDDQINYSDSANYISGGSQRDDD